MKSTFRTIGAILVGLVLGFSLIAFLWVFYFKNELYMAKCYSQTGRSLGSFPRDTTPVLSPEPTRRTPLKLIESSDRIHLRFKISGTLEWIAEPGIFVSSGCIIARLNNRETFLKMKKAKIQLKQIESYDVFGSSLPFWELEKAKTEFLQASAEYKRTILSAPQDGVLQDLFVKPGDPVSPAVVIGILAPAVRLSGTDNR